VPIGSVSAEDKEDKLESELFVWLIDEDDLVIDTDELELFVWLADDELDLVADTELDDLVPLPLEEDLV